jgi:hypothetical protein
MSQSVGLPPKVVKLNLASDRGKSKCPVELKSNRVGVGKSDNSSVVHRIFRRREKIRFWTFPPRFFPQLGASGS